MLQVIAYTLAISAALGLAAFCGEKLLAMLGRSRRSAWAVAMALSTLWPLAAMLWAEPIASPARDLQGVAEQPAVAAASPALPPAMTVPGIAEPLAAAADLAMAPMQDAWQLPLPSDDALLWAWALASALLLLYLAGTDLFLQYRTSRWRRVNLHDQQVWVSETMGPALLGAWRPKVVVPRWFLDEPATTQSLILQHERQHIAARDPLLLRLALLLLVVLPWNLPLWWQLRRLRQAIELDCDARVLRGGAEASAYGTVLLAVTQRAGSVPAGAVAMGEPVSALERRIRYLTAGAARYSAPRALAAVIFCSVGIGGALALDAPALPQGSSKIEVAATALVPAQPAPASAPLATEEPASTQSAPAQRQILDAAQAPAPRDVPEPRLSPMRDIPALPKLPRLTWVGRVPSNDADPRSEKNTHAAILAARPNIEREFIGDKVLVVFMTEGGGIDRSYVIDAARDVLFGDYVFPDVITPETHPGLVPELVAKRWEPLGLKPEQLGQMGFTMFDNKNSRGGELVWVLYAWPRRAGEPIGGINADSRVSWRASFTYADLVAVAEHHVPTAFSGGGSTPTTVPWLLLSPEGEVVDHGWAPTPEKWALQVMAEANPGRRIGLVTKVTNKLILGWLEPEHATSGN